MQDGAPDADGAGVWLRRRFADDPDPRIDITWQVSEPDDDAYHRLLKLLFASRPDRNAA